MPRFQRNLLLVIVPLTLALFHLSWMAQGLPEQIPTHFDAAGNADGWSSPSGFLWIFGALEVSLAGLFLGLGALLPVLPLGLINVPYKHHWFAEERREASLDWMGGYLSLSGGVTVLFLAGLAQLSLQAAGREESRLDNLAFYGLMGSYCVLLALGLVALFLRFRRPPA